MWSVGVLLYVLLTGCSPFGGDTKQETFCNISRCRLDFPDDLFEDVSPEARDLMRKLMVKDPSIRLTVTQCLHHPWFTSFDGPVTVLSLSSSSTFDDENPLSPTMPTSPDEAALSVKSSTPELTGMRNAIAKIEMDKRKYSSSSFMTMTSTTSNVTESAEVTTIATRAGLSHTENIYSQTNSSPMPVRIGLSPDRRDTFKKNMDSLAQKFSIGTEIVIIDQTLPGSRMQRRATATHTMPSDEVFKCTPVFVLGEEHQCSDSGSDTISEISTDSSSDRSSIYSDDSLDFILYGKTQGRASFPFTSTESDRWEHKHHSRAWPRECNGVVSKALSRFTTEAGGAKTSKASMPSLTCDKTGLEALRERGGNLVVIREPVRAGKYTRYSEVQCESVQARIRRFQVQGSS